MRKSASGYILHFKCHRMALVQCGGAKQHGKCESLWRCVQMQRQCFLTGCHRFYSFLPFSCIFCQIRAARVSLNHTCRKSEREGERECVSVVFSSVWRSTGKNDVKRVNTLYETFNKIMTIPNTNYIRCLEKQNIPIIA